MNIRKLIEEMMKNDVHSIGAVCDSIREILKNGNENLSIKDNIGIVAKLNDFLSAKSPSEQKEILVQIAEIFANYDNEPYSTYEIEKKLLKIIETKNSSNHADRIR